MPIYCTIQIHSYFVYYGTILYEFMIDPDFTNNCYGLLDTQMYTHIV